MAEQNKSLAKPGLRFPKFLGQTLREVLLSDVTTESAIRNGDKLPASSVMGVSKAEGIVPMDQRIIAPDIARYKVVRPDWFAYNPMRLNIGSIARWRGKAEVLVSPDYVVFRCVHDPESGIEPAFLDHFRQSDVWNAFASKGGDGSVRVRIYYKDLGRLGLVLPSRAEQQKIADCLTSLDELIAAQERKVGALRTYKSGLMQQLFPRQGETLPRLRFPEFRDAPEWERKTLVDIAQIGSGSTPSRSREDFFADGSIPWVKTTDLNNSLISETEEKLTPKARARINPAGSVLVAMYGGLKQIGRTGCLSVPAATNQAISVLVLDQKAVAPLFVLSWLNAKVKDWKRIASSSRKDPNITSADVAKFPITLPKPPEQQRIAALLLSIGSQVAAESNKLDALKAHKKGLMQQLFASPRGE